LNAPIISATGHPLFQFKTAEPPRLKRSLFSVIRHRFLSWLEKATPRAIVSTLTRLLSLVFIAAIVFVPQFLIGILADAATWRGYRIPMFLGLLGLTLYARPVLRWARRTRMKRRTGGRDLWEGLPVADVAHFLIRTGGWKRDEAMHELAIGEPTWKRLGDTLEKHGVLVRGPSNARVLRDISLPMLVRQLRDDFPLCWDEMGKTWTDKESAYGRYLRADGFKSRRLEEETARTERRADKAESRLEKLKEETTIFQQIAALHV